MSTVSIHFDEVSDTVETILYYRYYGCIDLLFKVTIPPLSGVKRKYSLQNSSEVNRAEHTEPIVEPIAKPDVLHVDA